MTLSDDFVGENLVNLCLLLSLVKIERSSTHISRSSVNVNRRSQYKISGIVCWSCDKRGHIRRDYFKLKNKNGKGIGAEFINDVAAVTDYTLDSVGNVSFITDNSLFDR